MASTMLTAQWIGYAIDAIDAIARQTLMQRSPPFHFQSGWTRILRSRPNDPFAFCCHHLPITIDTHLPAWPDTLCSQN
jgi:hypothetical protein